jgi:hypothetical protein
VLKQAGLPDTQFCILARVQNQADIRDLFLFKFFCEKFKWVRESSANQ